MVEVKNIEVFGLERAQRAIQNSFNVGEINTTKGEYKEKLSKALGNNMDPHQSHDAWLKGVLCTFDMKGNGVFMPEFQRYHFVEICMSQSTMHTMDKFMTGTYDPYTKYVDPRIKDIAVENYENWKKAKKEEYEYHLLGFQTQDIQAQKENNEKYDKLVYEAFERLVHNLPRGFELWTTVTTNYLALKTIVIQRFHHKNKEDWSTFVEACYSMPKFRELCGFEDSKWDLENW